MEEKKQKGNIIKLVFHYLVLISVVVMVALVFINAVMRYVFNAGFPATEELARFFFIWTIYLGIIAAFKDKEHVGVTLLVDKLKGIPKIIVNIIANLATLFALYVMFEGGVSFTKITADYKSPATGISFCYIAVSIAVASAAMVGLVVWEMYYNIKKKRKVEGGN